MFQLVSCIAPGDAEKNGKSSLYFKPWRLGVLAMIFFF